MINFQSLALALFGTFAAAAAWPAAGKCYGDCYAHDPSIVQRESDGLYFKFTTREYLEYATSMSLEGPWKIVGYVLPEGSKLKDEYGSDENVWAPDCSKVGDKYYCYYAISTFGTQESAIGLAISDNMEPGTWTDLGGIGISSKPGDYYNAIDPNLLQDHGVNYMTFGSFYGDIYQTTLNKDATRATRNAPYNVEFNSTGVRPSEGAFVWKEGKYNYLFWSSGQCCHFDAGKPAPGDEYKIMVCRSEHANGPYVDQNGRNCATQNGGTMIFGSHDNIYAPGGQGVFNDKALGPVIYYHYIDTTKGWTDGDTRFGWNVLKFENGWPVLK
ncbi:hypothetical protein KEM54_006094 [Ascosphaera aggregata]|nr:hypothetical protein KEM54_006094 [Ascosphaera aggregata]